MNLELLHEVIMEKCNAGILYISDNCAHDNYEVG